MAVTVANVNANTVANTEVSIGTYTTAGNYALWADINTLPIGQSIELYAYIKVPAAGTKRLCDRYSVGVGSSPMKAISVTAFCVTESYVEFCLKATQGSLTIPCTVQRVDG